MWYNFNWFNYDLIIYIVKIIIYFYVMLYVMFFFQIVSNEIKYLTRFFLLFIISNSKLKKISSSNILIF